MFFVYFKKKQQQIKKETNNKKIKKMDLMEIPTGEDIYDIDTFELKELNEKLIKEINRLES